MKNAIDPNFKSRVEESFARQRVMQLIGASLDAVEPGVVEISLAVREDLTQQDGYVHAGVVATILDSACGYAALTLMPRGCRVLSVEFKVNLLAPADGRVIRARGEVKRPGRTLTVCTADAFTDNTLCASMLATMICLDR